MVPLDGVPASRWCASAARCRAERPRRGGHLSSNASDKQVDLGRLRSVAATACGGNKKGSGFPKPLICMRFLPKQAIAIW